MIQKVFRVLYNAVRFCGKPYFARVLAVSASTSIEKSKQAQITIGKAFRTRRNVELNVRDQARLEIGNDVFLNSGCIITAREYIEIGDNTIFGPNVVVYDNDHSMTDGVVNDNDYETEPVKIGKNVWIGAGTIILKGSIVGDGCIIAAGSVVKGTVEPYSTFVQKRQKTVIVNRG